MSFTSDICPIGCHVLRKSFDCPSCMGVSTTPGATMLTRMPCLAYSIARLRVTASRPPLDDHRNGRIDPRDRMIHLGRGDIDDASAGVLSQHLLDRQLGDQEKTFEVDRCESTKIV